MQLLRLVLATAVVAGLSTTARAETVTGTFTYLDGDNHVRPIRNSVVEVWRFRPGVTIFGGWGWAMDMTRSTDANGSLSVAMPFVGAGVQYQLRVFATNPATKVFSDDAPFLLNPYYAPPGALNQPITKITGSPTDVHDFTFHYTELQRRQYFNIADAFQHGLAYASARRDPRETDTIAQVAASMQTVTATSLYEPVSKAIRLKPEDALDDHRLLHEYGHYLEERISSFVGIPATHNGCTAVAGVDVMDPGFAWMEGFAEYFAHAVGHANPNLTGALSPGAFEMPSCPGVTKPRASIERFVTAALFDLMDDVNEFGDGFCSAATIPGDTLVFQIFDHELDIGFQNPSLQHFANAWVARGLDVPMLRRSLDTAGITVTLPAASPRYDMSPAANFAVWRTVGTDHSQWWIAGGQGQVTDWGVAGDVPVPADYDGDGLTDLAVWRPTDGNWFVVKSGSNQIEVRQWGTQGDIPLPGDYDGDNEIDFAVYRPSDGNVYVFSDGCGFSRAIHIGAGTPVVGDFDGDGIDEPGTYTGGFIVQLSGGGSMTVPLGGYGTPVVRDYDGDGRSDFAVFDEATASWYWRESSTGALAYLAFGKPYDVPVPGDYGSTGKAQLAVWTPATGLWRVLVQPGTRRRPEITTDFVWGVSGDVPVPAP
ncbi:MAG: VCBS repeat-containing protein [Kofleriaceae bacterium]